MISSLHQQLLKTDDKDIVSFEAALEAGAMRKTGLKIPPKQG
jgi:hypothetical protein